MPERSGSSFGDKAVSTFWILFIILSIVAFSSKVQQGWSIFEWVRAEGVAFLFSAVAAVVIAFFRQLDEES